MPTSSNGNTGLGPRMKRADALLLLDVTRRLAACVGLNEQLNALVDVTVEAVGAERGTVFLHDPARNELFSYVTRGGREQEARAGGASEGRERGASGTRAGRVVPY